MGTRIFTMLMAFLVVLSFSLFAGDKEAKYVGAKKCKTCHNAEKNGQQYKIWEGTVHAKAYTDLKSDSAKEKAKVAGVEDPLKSDKCLSCHTTAAGKKNVDASYSVDEGVGCESCHGAGSEYKSMSTMKDKKAATAAGLLQAGEKTCKNCHIKDNPGHKGKFESYEKEFAKITHTVPAENDRRKK